jgi:hypothetical protein
MAVYEEEENIQDVNEIEFEEYSTRPNRFQIEPSGKIPQDLNS